MPCVMLQRSIQCWEHKQNKTPYPRISLLALNIHIIRYSNLPAEECEKNRICSLVLLYQLHVAVRGIWTVNFIPKRYSANRLFADP